MNSRRIFLKHAGLAAAGAMAIPNFACTPATAKAVGLQLYTLREEISKDVKGVIAQVAKAGYKEVETYGYSLKDGYWGLNSKDFKALLDSNNLKSPSGHFGLDDFIKNGNTELLKPLIEGAAAIGMSYFTCPWLDPALRTTADDFKKTSARLNEAADLCQKSGLTLAYHNHDFEFTKFGDTNGYEIMLQETDKKLVQFEMDLYWVVRSGNDPLSLFAKYPGRFPMWHVKDMDKTDNSINTEVGTGTIDFKAIHKEAKKAGLKHLIVEQENFSKDPFVSIKQSFDYVNRELI